MHSTHMHTFYSHACILLKHIHSTHTHAFYSHACILLTRMHSTHTHAFYSHAYILLTRMHSTHTHTFYVCAFVLHKSTLSPEKHKHEQGGGAGKLLTRMFVTAVTAGKRVRAETGIARGGVSISSAAVELVEKQVCRCMCGAAGCYVVSLWCGWLRGEFVVWLATW
jgi:hypothetical protein